MTDKIEVNRRRVLGGLVTIGAAGAAIGAGTFAAFSDSESSNDNTITAGELTLDVTGGNNGDANSFGYSFDDIAPGDSTTISADISITSDVDVTDITVGTSTDQGTDSFNLANALSIDSVSWNGNGITVSADTVGELANNDITLNSAPADGGTATLSMTVSFMENASSIGETNDINDYQGTSVDIDHTFSVDQDMA